MKIIVCLDERNGMSFCGKRQSMDRNLRQHVAGVVQNGRLWMNAYSAGQFADTSMRIQVEEDFLNKAGCEDYCFVENQDLRIYIDKIDELIVYRWRRIYPSDLTFPMDAVKDSFRLLSTQTLTGYSHEQILQEVYQR